MQSLCALSIISDFGFAASRLLKIETVVGRLQASCDGAGIRAMLEEALRTVGQALAMPVVVTEMATSRGAASKSQPMRAAGVQGVVLPPRTPPPPQIAGPAVSGGLMCTEQGFKHQMNRVKSKLGSSLCCVRGVLWLAALRMYQLAMAKQDCMIGVSAIAKSTNTSS